MTSTAIAPDAQNLDWLEGDALAQGAAAAALIDSQSEQSTGAAAPAPLSSSTTTGTAPPPALADQVASLEDQVALQRRRAALLEELEQLRTRTDLGPGSGDSRTTTPPTNGTARADYHDGARADVDRGFQTPMAPMANGAGGSASDPFSSKKPKIREPEVPKARWPAPLVEKWTATEDEDGTVNMVAHEGIELTEEDTLRVMIGGTLKEVGDRRGVAHAMVRAFLATKAPNALKVSFLRITINELKASFKPPLVNVDIGKLASVPPHDNPIAGKMVSTVMGGAGDIDPRVVSSKFFEPVLQLAMSYLVVRDAREHEGNDEPLEAHELGYEGNEALGAMRASAGNAATAAPPTWSGWTTLLADAVTDRVHAVGRVLPPGTTRFPNLTDADIKSIARHTWADMQGTVDEGKAPPGSPVAVAFEMGKEAWKGYERLKAYIQTKWGKLGDVKKEYLRKEAATGAASTSTSPDTSGATAAAGSVRPLVDPSTREPAPVFLRAARGGGI